VFNFRRREAVLAAAILVAAPLSIAQAPSRVWRIGFLTNGTVASSKGQLDAFLRGMGELGYANGKNLKLEPRWAEGDLKQLPRLVNELLAQDVDLIFAPSGVAAQAARQSGTTVPIVFALAPDPVGQGFGRSLADPGGNMTGLTSTHGELSAKRIELLKDTLPTIRRVSVLYHQAPAAAGVVEQLAETGRAAKILGMALVAEACERVEDFERVFAAIRALRPDALVVIESPLFFTHRVRLTELAATLRMPAIYNVSEYVQAGGLMSYGASYADLCRRAAAYVVKILNGARPGDLPIERPIKFELMINLKTARDIGLAVPRSVLMRADGLVGS
jgi:putative ABC transport system substrate-binding protein